MRPSHEEEGLQPLTVLDGCLGQQGTFRLVQSRPLWVMGVRQIQFLRVEFAIAICKELIGESVVGAGWACLYLAALEERITLANSSGALRPPSFASGPFPAHETGNRNLGNLVGPCLFGPFWATSCFEPKWELINNGGFLLFRGAGLEGREYILAESQILEGFESGLVLVGPSGY